MGVLLHQFEEGVFQGNVPEEAPWQPCDDQPWCDRWACSIVNAQLRRLFRHHSGIVLRPSALPRGALLCSCARLATSSHTHWVEPRGGTEGLYRRLALPSLCSLTA